MSSGFQPGSYLFRPQNALHQHDYLTTSGPTHLPHPLPDIPIRVNQSPVIWKVAQSINNTFNVFIGSGKFSDPKWINKSNALYASERTFKPEDFRIESAGNGLWAIGIFAKDLLLTYDPDSEEPQLTFKPANGSSAQHFEAIGVYGA